MTRLPLLAVALLLLCGASSAHAQGTAFFDDSTDVIQVDGQTVVGSIATYEAVVLFPGGMGAGGNIFNEWTGFQEDKRLGAGPSFVYGHSYPATATLGSLQRAVTMMPDVWHHVALVTDGADERLYLDGQLLASRPNPYDVGDGAGPAHIGAIFRDGVLNPGFVGYLESIRLSDVARYSDSSFTPPLGDLESDANTLLLLNFNEAAGSLTVVDESPLARVGTPGVGFEGATSPEFGTSPPATDCALSTTAADLWDVGRGAVVTGSTGFLSGSDAEGENIFGGNFSNPEAGTAFFRDDQPAGFVHAVEWETTGDVTVASFVLNAAHDDNGLNRSFNSFRLFGFNTSSSDFDLLFEFNPSIPYGGGPALNTLTVCANLPPVATNRFRAEFVQHGSGGFPGPRVYELDAFTTPKATNVGTEGVAAVPTAGVLRPGYPNPTSGTTSLPYNTSIHGYVRLAVYDLLGREVAVLFEGLQAAGSHEATMQAGVLPSGVYFVQLTTPDGFRQTRGLSVVR